MNCPRCGKEHKVTRLDAMIAAALLQAKWRADRPVNPITGEIMKPIVPPDFSTVTEDASLDT